MSRPEAADLTVVIPTWNQSRLLQGCLASLHRQTCRPAVLVVDNGSVDDTAEVVQRFPGVQYRHLSENIGFARAVNFALGAVRTPYVALLNNDTEAHPEWAEQGRRAFDRNPEHSFFASKIVQYFDRRYLDSAGDCYSRGGLPTKRGAGLREDGFDTPQEVLGASAGAAFYRRSMFEETGFLDEDFYMYLEDVEYSLRARLLGHRCLFLPAAIVYHMEAASDPERPGPAAASARGNQDSDQPQGPPPVYYSATRVYWITRNRWNLMVLYQPPGHVPYVAAAWIKSAGFHLLKEGFFGAFLRGLWDGLLHTPRFWQKRREWKQRCRLTTREQRQLFRMC